MPDVIKGRAQYSKAIAATWTQTAKATIEGFVQIGKQLIEAKEKLEHGQFEQMITEDLPFTARTARKFMVIAENPVLSNRSARTDLPATWTTLYELSLLPQPKLKKALKDGMVTPQTTLAEAKRLAKPTRPAPPPPPEEVEEEEEEPTVTVDALDNELDDELAAVFSEEHQLKYHINLLHTMRREIAALTKEPIGTFIELQPLEAELKMAAARLRFALPYAKCPMCRTGCKLCRKQRWLPKEMYLRNVPEELK